MTYSIKHKRNIINDIQYQTPKKILNKKRRLEEKSKEVNVCDEVNVYESNVKGKIIQKRKKKKFEPITLNHIKRTLSKCNRRGKGKDPNG